MKVRVTAKLFASPVEAFAEVSCELDLVSVPAIGSGVAFLFPNNEVMPIAVPSFPGILRVSDVWFAPQSLGNAVTIKLEDVVLTSRFEAQTVMRFLEQGFGLVGDEV